MTNRRSFSIVRALIAAAIALPLMAAAPADISLHVLLPLTGPEAYLGKQEKTAIDAAEKLVNSRGGTPVHAVYHDDQSKPDVAVQLLSQLAADKVPLVLGPAARGTCLALAPLVAKGPVNYCFSPTMHAESGSYVFMTGVDTYDLDRAMVRYARLRGWKKIGLITSTDATGADAVKAYDMILKDPENKDLSIVERANFNAADISVAAQLSKIKSAQPDVLFAWTTGLGMGTIFKGLQQVNLNIPIATSWGNMTYTQMKNWTDTLPQDLYFPSAPWPGNPSSHGLDSRVEGALKDMNAAFAATGDKPDAGADVAWDPFLIAGQVMRKLGPNATADQVRDALQAIKGFAGINGIYDFSKYAQRGVGEQNAVVTRWSPEHQTWDIVSRPLGIPLDTKAKR